MGTLACLLGVLAAGLGFGCWLLFIELERRGVEIAQVRRQLDRYLHDDQRMVDALWNRAQIEADRVTRRGGQS